MATRTRSLHIPENVRAVHDYCDARRSRVFAVIRGDGPHVLGANAAKRQQRTEKRARRAAAIAEGVAMSGPGRCRASAVLSLWRREGR
jgi:hypothetical protein